MWARFLLPCPVALFLLASLTFAFTLTSPRLSLFELEHSKREGTDHFHTASSRQHLLDDDAHHGQLNTHVGARCRCCSSRTASSLPDMLYVKLRLCNHHVLNNIDYPNGNEAPSTEKPCSSASGSACCPDNWCATKSKSYRVLANRILGNVSITVSATTRPVTFMAGTAALTGIGTHLDAPQTSAHTT
jgi:hypothetical protein